MTVNRGKVADYHVLLMFTLLKCPPTLCKPTVHAVMRKQGDVEVQEDGECVQQQHQEELHHPEDAGGPGRPEEDLKSK